MYFERGHATAGGHFPSQSWYFAEGGTSHSLRNLDLIQNPNKEPAVANITFFKEDGSTIAHQMLIPHVSRASLLVNQIVPDAAVATRIETDRPIVGREGDL